MLGVTSAISPLRAAEIGRLRITSSECLSSRHREFDSTTPIKPYQARFVKLGIKYLIARAIILATVAFAVIGSGTAITPLGTTRVRRIWIAFRGGTVWQRKFATAAPVITNAAAKHRDLDGGAGAKVGTTHTITMSSAGPTVAVIRAAMVGRIAVTLCGRSVRERKVRPAPPVGTNAILFIDGAKINAVGTVTMFLRAAAPAAVRTAPILRVGVAFSRRNTVLEWELRPATAVGAKISIRNKDGLLL